MKIEVIKIIFGDDDYDYVYKYLPFQYCCDKLKHNPNIQLDSDTENQQDFCSKCEYNQEYNQHCKTCNAITVSDQDENFPSFKIHRIERIQSWDDEFEDDYALSINFCPHCGEKIEIKCVKEIDKTEEFQKLQEDRNRLWKKCCETDSINYANELKEKVCQLDRQINYFYHCGLYID